MAKKNKNEMSFLDHLEDLRWLLVRSSAVIVIMAIVTYAFSDFIFDDIIFGPTHTDFITYRFFCDLAQSLGVTGDICVNDLPFTIQNTSMEGQINVFIWTCITAGFILAFYFIYSMIRNFNSRDARQLEALALSHARAIIHLQQTLGIYHEEAIQKWALQTRALIVGSNYFYGSLHFVVTIGVGIFLYRKWQNDYPLWRNTIAIATALALIGFIFWLIILFFIHSIARRTIHVRKRITCWVKYRYFYIIIIEVIV